MKVFVDPEEKFVIKIKEDWYFSATHHSDDSKKQPFGFEPYEKRNFAFLVSCRKVKPNVKVNVKLQPKGKADLEFMVIEEDGITAWITEIENGYTVLLTLSYDNKINKEELKKIKNQARESVSTFMFLDEISNKNILPKARWDNLMISYASSLDLSNRAYKNGSNIELVILLANQIDAVLRQIIILKKQLINGNDHIEESLIFQRENDRPILEKTIYKMAFDDDLITDEEYKKLMKMYNLRNKVVHRYIISDLRTVDIIKLVVAYSEFYDLLSDKLVEFEQTQFEKQIGIYATDLPPGSEANKETIKSLVNLIRDKHGNRVINDGITFNKNL